LRNTNRLGGTIGRASERPITQPWAIKGGWSRGGKAAEKVSVLTWGDLLSSRQASLFERTGWERRSQQRPYDGSRHTAGRAER